MAPLSAKIEPQEMSSVTEEIGNPTPSPVLRLHLDELSHPATSTFLSQIDSTRLLGNAISHIVKHLYDPLHNSKPNTSKSPTIHIPPTRSVTLILRSMSGVAYTTGILLDSAHKEIHLNLDYASRFISQPTRFRDEIIGVVTHEMVHAYQWDANGTCPGGLIEGIADYVRLKAGLSPPHWKRDEAMERWDVGYQRTAYFLEWLEEEYGRGMVARINAALREAKYEGETFWTGIFGEGKDVEWLFKKYRDSLKGKEDVVECCGKGAYEAGDGEKDASGDDGVLVELEDAERMVVHAQSDIREGETALR